MILLIFVLRHAGLCGILGDESLRPSIFCHQLNKYSAYLYINHCHHHLSHEKYFYNTIKHFYLWVFSWGSSFEQLMCLDTTIVSLFFKKKKKKKSKSKREKRKEWKKKNREKEKERGDIHNQSINHWCLTHLSCI